MGTTIGGLLVGQGLRVRLVEADRERAHDAAEAMPDVRVFHASAFDSTFLERQRIGQAAAVYCMNDDAKNLYSAVLAKEHGVRLTIALAHDPTAVAVYDRGGVDVAINRAKWPPRRWCASRTIRVSTRSRCSKATASRSSTSRCAQTPSWSTDRSASCRRTMPGGRRRDPQRHRHLPARVRLVSAGDRVIVHRDRHCAAAERAL